MRASVFIATSLDGYIARLNGDLDWLPANGEAFEGTFPRDSIRMVSCRVSTRGKSDGRGKHLE